MVEESKAAAKKADEEKRKAVADVARIAAEQQQAAVTAAMQKSSDGGAGAAAPSPLPVLQAMPLPADGKKKRKERTDEEKETMREKRAEHISEMESVGEASCSVRITKRTHPPMTGEHDENVGKEGIPVNKAKTDKEILKEYSFYTSGAACTIHVRTRPGTGSRTTMGLFAAAHSDRRVASTVVR